MKIAIAHYHLNRGGVTQVIFNQLKSLGDTLAEGRRLQVALLYGGRRDGWPEKNAGELSSINLSLHPLCELDYDNIRPPGIELADKIQTTLCEAGFDSKETVLHFHNHSLAKNSALPGAIAALAQCGFATLLQIHDFAEDFRPDRYCQIATTLANDFAAVPKLLYPQASHVHYAVLNGRDYSVLHSAGVDKSRLHLLPNSVTDIGPLPPRKSTRKKLEQRFGVPINDRLVVYPVRGIRRKNLGEALLWSALADKKTWFGLTLAPQNPVEQQSYQRWKNIAGKLKLKCVFELGGPQGMDFSEILAASDLILTTSVAEGFGLVFLETWLAGRTLVGRDLPPITSDFVESGIRLPGLQTGLLVPVDWFDESLLFQEITDAYQNVLAAYRRPSLEQNELRFEINRLVRDGLIDFAVCPTNSQQQVIERVASNPIAHDRLLEINPAVGKALRGNEQVETLIQDNARIVRNEYSLTRMGQRLFNAYQQLADNQRDQTLQPVTHGDRILDQFLDISRFHCLRVEP